MKADAVGSSAEHGLRPRETPPDALMLDLAERRSPALRTASPGTCIADIILAIIDPRIRYE